MNKTKHSSCGLQLLHIFQSTQSTHRVPPALLHPFQVCSDLLMLSWYILHQSRWCCSTNSFSSQFFVHPKVSLSGSYHHLLSLAFNSFSSSRVLLWGPRNAPRCISCCHECGNTQLSLSKQPWAEMVHKQLRVISFYTSPSKAFFFLIPCTSTFTTISAVSPQPNFQKTTSPSGLHTGEHGQPLLVQCPWKDHSQGVLTLFIPAVGVQHTHLSTCSASSGEITLIFWCDICIHLRSNNPKSTSGDSSELPSKKEGQTILTVGGINAIYLLYSCIIMKSKACRRQTSVSRKQVIAWQQRRPGVMKAGREKLFSHAAPPGFALHPLRLGSL